MDLAPNMKIKNVLLIGAIVAAMLPAAIADQVYISDGGDGFPGGEFSAKLLPGGPTFKTFCLETGETLAFNKTYDYTISSAAFYGGVGEDGDPISLATAWLYYHFVEGTLTDNAAKVYSSSAADENDLQGAFWWLEGENHPGYGDVTVAAVSDQNRYVLQAKAMLGEANYLTDANGRYGVYAMNLTQSGLRRQDVLIRVPEGGLTAAMLGMSLAGLAFVARRRQ